LRYPGWRCYEIAGLIAPDGKNREQEDSSMNRAMTGAVIATAVASLFAAKIAVAEYNQKGEEAKKVHCHNVNECKGKGECGTATHDCAGKNACKGKGWISLTEEECKERGGQVK
jgi:uncharacterized membrane protein